MKKQEQEVKRKKMKKHDENDLIQDKEKMMQS